MAKRQIPEITDQQEVAKTNRFTIERIGLKFSNGEERNYECFGSQHTLRGAVIVAPVLNDETVLLVREYAVGIHAYELGFPKGVIDPGEKPIEAAHREMMEEVGYGAKSLHYLTNMFTSPGHARGQVHLVVGTDLYPEKQEGDEPEPLEVVPWPLAKLEDLLDCDDFKGARNIASLFLVKRFFENRGVQSE